MAIPKALGDCFAPLAMTVPVGCGDPAVLVGTGVPAGARHSRPARRPVATKSFFFRDYFRESA